MREPLLSDNELHGPGNGWPMDGPEVRDYYERLIDQGKLIVYTPPERFRPGPELVQMAAEQGIVPGVTIKSASRWVAKTGVVGPTQEWWINVQGSIISNDMEVRNAPYQKWAQVLDPEGI